MRQIGLGCAMLILLATATSRGAVINVGERLLEPDQPGQTIEIRVSGGEAVSGVNFYVLLDDGGPAAGASEPVDGPIISDVNLTDGTIFDGNHNTQVSPTEAPWVWTSNVTTQSGTVTADGVLATITFNTTGLHEGSWPLRLMDPLGAETNFVPGSVSTTVNHGTVHIPEPASAALLVGSALAAALRRPGTRRRGPCRAPASR